MRGINEWAKARQGVSQRDKDSECKETRSESQRQGVRVRDKRVRESETTTERGKNIV